MPSAVRREQILDAACELFAEFGYSGATTKQLAEKVGCSEAIIFRIFPTKEAIFETLFEEWKQADIEPETLDILDGSAMKTLEKFYGKLMEAEDFSAGQLVRTGWRRKDLGRAIMSRNGEEKWGNAIAKSSAKATTLSASPLQPVIRFGQQNGEIKDGDPELLSEFFWSMVFGLVAIRRNYP